MSNPHVTTDGTTATMVSIAPPSGVDSTASFDFEVHARSGSTCATFAFRASAKCVSGATSLVGTVTATSTQKDGGAAAWTATADVSGGVVRVRVTGAAATQITWTLLGERGVYTSLPWSES